MTSCQTSFWDLSNHSQEQSIATVAPEPAPPASFNSTDLEMTAFNSQPIVHLSSSSPSNGLYLGTHQAFLLDHNEPFMEIATGRKHTQQLPKQRWEELKPIIRQLYIVQKFNFDEVIKTLRDLHGVTITRRQFYRKIDEWKFAKNVKSHEMRKLVENLDERSEFNGTLVVHEAEVTQAKIKRYKRNTQRTALVPYTSVELISSLPADSSTRRQCRSMRAIHGGELPPDLTVTAFRNETLPTTLILDVESLSSPGSSSDWNEVDVPGSPNLSRLFRALDLESSKDIPDISLENPDNDEYQYLSTEQVKSLCPVQAGQPDWATDSLEKQTSNIEVVQTFNSLNGNLNDSDSSRNMFFRSYRSGTMSFELSPFPKTSHEQPPSWVRWYRLTGRELKQQQLENEQALSKLSNLFPTSHPAILQIKRNLGGIYNTLGRSEDGKALLEEIASTASEIYGPEHIKTLDASLEVFESNNEPRFGAMFLPEAQKLYDTIHQLLPPEHGLAQRSSLVLSKTLHYTGCNLEASSLARQSLQIELTVSGPRSYMVRQMMRMLAVTLTTKGLYFEAEHLFRTAMRLLRDNLITASGLMYDIGWILGMQGRDEESLTLYREVAARHYELVGLHPNYLKSLYKIAYFLTRLGRFEEGENVCKEILDRYHELVGNARPEFCLTTSWLMAACLVQRGEYEGAATLYEHVFKEMGDNFGIESWEVLKVCQSLGKCYQSLGRLDDMLKLYQNALEEVSKAEGADCLKVEWLQELKVDVGLQQDSEDWLVRGRSSDSEDEIEGH